MVNTRILTREFDYHRPDSLEEAFELLTEYGNAAKVIAGGTDVVPKLKYEKIAPNHLITLMKISGLSDITAENGGLSIGACARLRDVKQACARGFEYATLHDAMRSIGKVQVMNMGTLGGNLCTASPAADSVPPLLVLNGRVTLLSRQGSRTLDLEDFITGPYTAAMAADEIMTEIRIPPAGDQQGSAFLKVSRVAADISKLSCAVALQRDARRCIACRIALGAVAPVPMRIKGAEKLLSGRQMDSNLMDEAAASVSAEIRPISDVRSTEAYRRQVAAVIFKDVFASAWQRAGGKR
ncbi:MAG: xanthine dehydrogenase family protein subunit M [Deltaproteobacteria bacterium]